MCILCVLGYDLLGDVDADSGLSRYGLDLRERETVAAARGNLIK